MELKNMNQNDLVVCPHGHYYHSSNHANCPLCTEEGNFPKTESPSVFGSAAGSFPKTEGPAQYTAASAGSFVHTEAPDTAVHFNEDTLFPKTVIGGYPRNEETQFSEPIVGWLVCIEGPLRGSDFRIHAGYNYIGRETGDIRLHGDLQISRENHAQIAFDSDECLYFIGPAGGRNIIKVNSRAVINSVELNAYDIISIGTTKLLFMPLCSERFSWDRV